MVWSRRDFVKMLAATPLLGGLVPLSASEPQKMFADELATGNITGGFGVPNGILRFKIDGEQFAIVTCGGNVTYSQPIKIWQPDHDPDKRYYTGGRAQCSMRFGRAVCPAATWRKIILPPDRVVMRDMQLSVLHEEAVEDEFCDPAKEVIKIPELTYNLKHVALCGYNTVCYASDMVIVDWPLFIATSLDYEGKSFDFQDYPEIAELHGQDPTT